MFLSYHLRSNLQAETSNSLNIAINHEQESLSKRHMLGRNGALKGGDKKGKWGGM